MLTNLMGRDAALAGLRDFIDKYGNGPDYPVLQDLVATLRPHAPDPAAFDAFVKDWYFGVVVPEYRLTDAKKQKVAAAWVEAGGTKGSATASASGTAAPGGAGAAEAGGPGAAGGGRGVGG